MDIIEKIEALPVNHKTASIAIGAVSILKANIKGIEIFNVIPTKVGLDILGSLGSDVVLLTVTNDYKINVTGTRPFKELANGLTIYEALELMKEHMT